MNLLVLSRHLSFHARGDAAFVWHGLTGDVAEMSRDVVALLLAFSPAADSRDVVKNPPAGLPPHLVEQYVDILRSRRFLVVSPSRGNPDETSPLLQGFPRVPRGAIFHHAEGQGPDDPPRITVYGRDGQKLVLDPVTARLFDRCNGERTLGQVLADAGPDAIDPLLRLARADFAAIKILAKKVSEGGVRLNPAADSTMPYPEIPDVRAFAAGADGPGPAPGDLRAYHTRAIADAEAQFEEKETTLSHLFHDPHPSLRGRTWGAALADGLLFKGALKSCAGRKARLLEVGGGLGYVGKALREALSAKGDHGATGLLAVNVDLSPALAQAQKRRGLAVARGDALKLPVKPESLDLIVANEMAGDLGTSLDLTSLQAPPAPPKAEAPAEPDEPPAPDAPAAQVSGEAAAHVAAVAAQAQGAPPEEQRPRFKNDGALELVRQAAAALAPGGMLFLSEFGDPKANPVKSDHLDHDEWSIRFDDLKAEAQRLGLHARVHPIADLVSLDGAEQALSTTRASYAAIKALFADHGITLTKRAWLRREIEALCAGKLDLSQVRGLLWAPLGERTMGLSPRQFFCLIATRQERTLH